MRKSMGWNEPLNTEPTGYWFAWQTGLRGLPERFKAGNEQEARQAYFDKYGYWPDHVEQELD